MRNLLLAMLGLCLLTPARAEDESFSYMDSRRMMNALAQLDEAGADAYVSRHVAQLSRVLPQLDMGWELDRATAQQVAQILVRGGCSSRAALPALKEVLAKLPDDSVPIGDIALYPPTSVYGSIHSVVNELEARTACPLVVDARAKAEAGDSNSRLDALYREVIAAEGRRSQAMQKLVRVVAGFSPEEVSSLSDESVDRLSRLLETDDEAIAYDGARALGAIACRAGSALPALRAALVKGRPIESDFGDLILAPSASDAYQLQQAITKIEAAPAC